jgi:putative hydrolase of the HAD superfamily
MIKTVIFDLDNTLYDYDKCHALGFSALGKYCEETFSMTEEQFAPCYQKGGAMVIERAGIHAAAIHSRTLRFQCMMEQLQKPLFPYVEIMYQIYWDAFLAGIRPYPGILEFMTALKKLGIKIGIGTNMTARMQYKKLVLIGAAPLVDFVVTSEEAGAEKPAPAFFRLCLKKAGCSAQECAFIGDNMEHDVEGSLHAGMRGILYTQEIQPETAPEVEYIVSYLDCLKESLL